MDGRTLIDFIRIAMHYMPVIVPRVDWFATSSFSGNRSKFLLLSAGRAPECVARATVFVQNQIFDSKTKILKVSLWRAFLVISNGVTSRVAAFFDG
jgi:hypothetical protein